MAKSVAYGSGKEPSKWAIVLVALLLILLPSLFCGIILYTSSTGGAQIQSVAPSSPASGAGLQRGDLITAINGKAISSTQQFIETVDTYPPGQTVTLTVKRGGSTLHIRLKLGTRPSSPPTGG